MRFSLFSKKVGLETKASLAYFLSSLILQGMGLITLPFFSRLMSSDQIGIATIYNSWYSILGTIATLSLYSGAMNVAMVEFSEDRDGYQSSIIALSALASLVFAGLFLLFYPAIMDFVKLPKVLVYTMLLGFVVQPAQAHWLTRKRFEFEYKSSSIVTVVSSLLATFSAIYFVYYASKKGCHNLAEVRILAMAVVSYTIAGFFFVQILIRGRKLYSKEYWKFALSINIPLIIHTLAKQLFDVSDKLMIAELVGESEVGVYGVLTSISALSIVVWSAINASLVPYMFTRLKRYSENKDTEALSEISRIITPLLIIYSVVCLLLSLLAPEIVLFLTTKEYFQAVYLVPPLAAGVFFGSLYSVYGNILLFYKRTKLLMLATLVSAIVNIILNYVLIPQFGYAAAAYTTLFSQILLTVLQFVFSRNLSKHQILEGKRIWTIAAFLTVSCLCVILIYQVVILRLIVAILVAAVVFFFRRNILSYLQFKEKEV